VSLDNFNFSYETTITDDDRLFFAKLSGDYNPLHVDSVYASRTEFGKCILHGAFSAGLLSRMAGMHIPGKDCLLMDLRLKFIRPVITPVTLRVDAHVKNISRINGEVEVKIFESESEKLVVEGAYGFIRHQESSDLNQGTDQEPIKSTSAFDQSNENAKFLIIGASGGLGCALMNRLNTNAIGTSRKERKGFIFLKDISDIEDLNLSNPIMGIINCGWPSQDNTSIFEGSIEKKIAHHVSQPLQDCLHLAKYLKKYGEKKAVLVLIGSTAEHPGRHNWRSPMYSLGKSLMPTLAKILSLELASNDKRVVVAKFDILDGGMSSGMTPFVRQAHLDRIPSGRMASLNNAAEQIEWLLQNSGTFISGSVFDFTGGALP
jgi:acyl dehydratase